MSQNGDSYTSSTDSCSTTRPTTTNTADEVVQVIAGAATDIQPGEMRQVDLWEGKRALLVRRPLPGTSQSQAPTEADFFAVSANCTHYGAPLRSGALGQCAEEVLRVRCPWHGACFRLDTGDIEEFPDCGSLHRFQVHLDDKKQVIITANKQALLNPKRQVQFCKADLSADRRVFIVVGAGAAGCTAVSTLRGECKFRGRVILVGAETSLPYDRPKLSKSLRVRTSAIRLHERSFFDDLDIELILGCAVTDLDTASRTLTLQDGRLLRYDRCLLASGAAPRRIAVPNHQLGNIFVLRTPSDASHIASTVPGKHVCILGSSFIGMEAAAAVAKTAASVTVIGMEKTPFERVLGAEVGSALQQLHEKNGVVFRMQRTLREYRGNNGIVTEICLDDGTVLPADVCILGAGVIPSTEYVRKEQVTVFRDGSLVADAHLCVAPSVYAAGDICRYPYHLAAGRSVRIEHWATAGEQARVATRNMMRDSDPAAPSSPSSGLGAVSSSATPVSISSAPHSHSGSQSHSRLQPFRAVPFFWTQLFGKSLRYAGHAYQYDRVVIRGDLGRLQFVAFYVLSDQVLAVATMNMDPLAAQLAERLHSTESLRLDEVDREELLAGKL